MGNKLGKILERKSYGQSVVTRSGYGGETTTYGGDTHNFHSTHTALHRGYAEPATTSFVVGKGDCACNVKITVTVSSSPKIATNVTTINDTYDFNKRYVDLDLTRGNGSVIVSTNGIIAEQADRPASVHTYNTTKRLTSHESDIVRRSNTPSHMKIDYPKTRASHTESSSNRASNIYSSIKEPVNSSVQWREVHSKSSHTGPTITEISNAEYDRNRAKDQFWTRSQANVSSQGSN
ncbi:unnamed protein product [Didymodactylos carnosus]|uniref:Uncharacterized protein n=1 Tax=Didymodactylos carnosus TaxID=1234261 RepID=A0A8S2E475_9BILA|nr:unnamed protein product [Didymodactylos carnosus]CAF3845025.1 unnamed protein product [Didymodactylos carnosus]